MQHNCTACRCRVLIPEFTVCNVRTEHLLPAKLASWDRGDCWLDFGRYVTWKRTTNGHVTVRHCYSTTISNIIYLVSSELVTSFLSRSMVKWSSLLINNCLKIIIISCSRSFFNGKKDCFDTVICSKSREDTKLQKLEPNWTFLFYISNSKFTNKTWCAKFSMQPLTTEYHFQMDIYFYLCCFWNESISWLAALNI